MSRFWHVPLNEEGKRSAADGLSKQARVWAMKVWTATGTLLFAMVVSGSGAQFPKGNGQMSDDDDDEFDGGALDSRIREALKRFEERISALERSAKTDAADIRQTFLEDFHDGNPERAPDTPAMATEVAALLSAFVKRRSEVADIVGQILIRKDMALESASMRLAVEAAEVATSALRELPAVYAWLDDWAAGRDPGSPPDVDTLQKVIATQEALRHIQQRVREAGTNVAVNIEMLADIVDLRVQYLHEFKLANLKLSPEETLERIMSRFKDQPTSIARAAALQLLKGTVLAIVTPVVERQLPWSTIVDISERLQVAIIGKRLDTDPSGTDALMILKRNLADQAEALETLLADCRRFEKELTTLSSEVLETPPEGVRH
ncbi:hypothetical protein FNA67_10280 [Youhaiella tibetensis]|uniref:Uncharacterized protein n=1 Tax=Paradevosia tibetensis TaxID=1447062 RepID=A0A5B9DN34_9HYPH|nr:hypothetical protein [Youhaiella tibetensis]QEE20533.1 hypothetical protein FNA67_10280 [Youhaiella tibetensis]